MNSEHYWVIRSLDEVDDETGKPLYWSNKDGWVSGESDNLATYEVPWDFKMIGNSTWEQRA